MEMDDGGLPSLVEEVCDDGDDVLEVPGCRGRSIERSRKVSMLDRSGRRFLDSSRSPFRHSFVDVRVFYVCVLCIITRTFSF